MQSAQELAAVIAQATRAERERQGLRQDEVALAAGVSPRTVFQVEQGKPTSRLDVLARILAALGLSLQVSQAPRTLARPDASQGTRFEVRRDTTGAYRWSLVAANNKRLATSEPYQTREAALRAVDQVAAGAGGAVVHDATT